MPRVTIEWTWEDAFNKFGFGDGDGPIFTDSVVEHIASLGYTVSYRAWGVHNDVVDSIQIDGEEFIPRELVGYGDPRLYLPPALVHSLDSEFR